MALKRKRSSPTFSSPSSISSDATTQSSSLPFFYQHSKTVQPLCYKPTWAFPTYDDRSSDVHLTSRTRKRHRDNRPDEQQVYASTIDRLFQAQRQYPDASPVPSNSAEQTQAHSQPQGPQRTTLHSFWNIRQPPILSANEMDRGLTMVLSDSDTRCEDCDRSLRAEYAMEVDASEFEKETRCQICARQICDVCAITSSSRTCLACASRAS